MNEEPLVSLITIDFNSADYTAALIQSLKHSNYTNWELIIVDNGTNNTAKDRFKNCDQDSIFYYKPKKNLGFAGGNNYGIEKSKGEYVFFVNNDTEITPNLIGQLVSRFGSIPRLGIVSPKILFYDSEIIQYAGYTQLDWRMRNRAIGNKEKDGPLFNELSPTFSAHGAAMMTTRSIIKEVGLMPEEYFLYYEEMDWCQMIKKSGYKIYVDQHSVIFHKESMSIGKTSQLKVYYLNRNRILYSRRNQPRFKNLCFICYSYLIVLPIKSLKMLMQGQVRFAKELLKAHYWNFSHKRWE